MTLTKEMMIEFAAKAPETDGDKLRLVLTSFVVLSEEVFPGLNWRDNEIVDDMLRIAAFLDSVNGGTPAPAFVN